MIEKHLKLKYTGPKKERSKYWEYF